MTNLQGKPFVLLGVHVGGTNIQQLKQVMDKEKITWRSFCDQGNAGAGPIATSWNLTATPTFYLIDHQGVIRRKWTGAPSAQVLDEAIEKLIKAAEGK